MKYHVTVPDIIINRIEDLEYDPKLEIAIAMEHHFSNIFGSHWVDHWKDGIKVGSLPSHSLARKYTKRGTIPRLIQNAEEMKLCHNNRTYIYYRLKDEIILLKGTRTSTKLYVRISTEVINSITSFILSHEGDWTQKPLAGAMDLPNYLIWAYFVVFDVIKPEGLKIQRVRTMERSSSISRKVI